MVSEKPPVILWQFGVGTTEYVLRCTESENPGETFTMVVTENGVEVFREVITMSPGGDGWRIPYQHAVELVNEFRARGMQRRADG